MDFKVTEIKTYISPPNFDIDNLLGNYNTTYTEVKSAIKNHTFSHNNRTKGFQIELHDQLQYLFQMFFVEKGLVAYPMQYSSTINLQSDLAVLNKERQKGIYIEIEFRPNEFKDIVKFQIGYQNNLELGILIVAQNRENINKSYTTMPEFNKCKDVITALVPECPILLVGIDGKYRKGIQNGTLSSQKDGESGI